MERLTSGILIVACAIGIAAGATYLAKTYRVDCVDWFPFGNARTCAVTQK